MDIQRPLPQLQRAHSSSAPAAMASLISAPPDSDSEEDETCRICKSESTPSTPLFHPCKCSGSIKYVHQDCLMEWLERSQKKHCELCKTPFRFTKLYERDMPGKLPMGLFVKHMLLHGAGKVRTALRALLVGLVWAVGLPWVLRCIWGVMFFVADGGWWVHDLDSPHPELGAALAASHEAIRNHAQNPPNALYMTYGSMHTSPRVMYEPINAVYKLVMDQAHNNATFANISYHNVLRALFYPAAFDTHGLPAGSRVNETLILDYPIRPPPMIIPQQSDSILSGIPLLQNLTKNAALNNLIITILEGQIITVVVVVCFILIFLIREWVVQQQPGINVGAGFDAQVPAPQERVEEAQQEVQRLMRMLEEANEANERNVREGREWGREVDDTDEVRPATPPIARRDTENEAQRAEWGAQEEEARENEMHFVHREGAAPNHRLPVEGQREGLDENGALIPVIGTTTEPTTEYALRGQSHEEKERVVHERLFEHVRFIIPGLPGKITDLMIKEDGVDGVLQYIDYEEEIHQKLNATLLNYNQQLIDERKPAILTKEEGREHILEALVSQIAEDHKARDEENVVRTIMNLDVPLILRILGNTNAAEKVVRDLDLWDGLALNDAAAWATGIVDSTPFPNAEGHSHSGILENWEDEEIEDDAQLSEREKAYRDSVRARRESHSSSVYDESDEEDPYSASRPDGGLLPERRRYEARVAARLQNGEKRAGEEGHPSTTQPFKFNFDSADLEPEKSEGQRMGVTDAAGPAPRYEAGPHSQPSTVGGLITPPTPVDEDIDTAREILPTEAAQGVVGFTMSGRQMISDAEMMRRLNADDDGWQGDNDGTAFTQDTEDSGMATELRTPEEIAETERLEAAAEAARLEAARPQTLAGKLAFWLWGDAEAEEDAGVDDEHIVDDLAAEAPFVPVNHGHHEHHDHHHIHDHFPVDEDDQENENEIEEPPLQQALAGFADDLDNMDPEAIDEAEDFDGIMELVGMRGPVFALLQNCLIGIILLTITIFIGIWVPYITGKVTLLMVAHPVSTLKLPLRAVFKVISLVQDLLMIAFGGCYYTFIKAISFSLKLFGKSDLLLAQKNSGIVGLGAVDVVLYAGSAVERIVGDFISFFAPDADNLPTFSAASHGSLLYLKGLVASMFDFSSSVALVRTTISENGITTALLMTLSYTWHLALAAFLTSAKWLVQLPALLALPDTWVITLSSPARQQSLDLALSHWNAIDRTYAIITGYLTFISLGAAYVSKGSPFSTSTTGKEWEALAIDILNQAGGVLKVILIISIEMLVFPLYCGLLLDVATLPLFEGATLMSRITFGINSPFTSMFVHWFVGTCYMFHFALFVSMCRKILRRGTLYFIRDPDDPTFHPVRDVLERNIATQLRKIGFSALVYGALVLVCLGGVVWSLSFIFQGVLPIRWSSNEPVLEFPIDLLFYNFLMPLAVRYFKPSKGLHEMYRWWFVQSAHYLRLSHFLLGDRRLDEELWAVPNSGVRTLEELEDEQLTEIIEAQAPMPPNAPLPTAPEIARKEEFEREWVNKGRYVRAPASDMVRIPKSKSVFLEVNAKNERLDGKSEAADDLHGQHKIDKKEIEMVYHPPHFSKRVIGFIGALWMFAAVTGCSATLIPLVIGRRIFAYVLPAEVERNDVYAFAMGANLLFGTLYAGYYTRGFITRSYASLMAADPISAVRTTAATTWKVLKLSATYFAFLAIIPALLAMLMEFYIILPLHSFLIPGEQHTVHFIQSWTLGLLMTNLVRRWILSEEWGVAQSRAAVALRRVVRRGYGDLDVQLAWRGFILPICLAATIALANPMVGATLAVNLGILEPGVKVYRNAYPAMMAVALLVVGMLSAVNKLKQWRMSIRDEVYLIGERLHNYTDKGKGRERRRMGQRRIET